MLRGAQSSLIQVLSARRLRGRALGGRASRRCWMVADALRSSTQKERTHRSLIESGQLSMGRYSYGMPEVLRFPGEEARVVIGSFCSIADKVRIFVGGNHRTDWVSTFPFRIVFGLPGQYSDGCPSSKGDVVIGHDVWIGSGASLLSGVSVGNGAVVGASSVVACDVPPYAIVVGNPARVVRRRFSDEQVANLELIAWWNWPIERILDSVAMLCGPDVDLFSAQLLEEG